MSKKKTVKKEKTKEVTPVNNITVYQGVRISPYAYQKILYFMYRGDTEVTGFGVTDPNDHMLIVDFKLVKQECTAASIDMSKEGLDEYINKMMDQNIFPQQCFRYWIHTHPGNSPSPSSVDEKQFDEFMENYPWIVMLIFAQDQSTYCRLGVNQGPGARCKLDVTVDWSIPLEKLEFAPLEEEYLEHVTKKTYIIPNINKGGLGQYQQNFQGINWHERHSMQQFPESDNTPWFMEDHDLWTEKDEKEYNDDEMDQILLKDVHEMTTEEFEAYEEYINQFEDCDPPGLVSTH